MTGRADFLDLGDWNAICYECGRKRKASTLKRHWQGYWVCASHWEPRQEQDFVRAIPDVQTPPWTQPPPAALFLDSCTANGRTAIPNQAIPNCVIPDFIDPSYIAP